MRSLLFVATCFSLCTSHAIALSSSPTGRCSPQESTQSTRRQLFQAANLAFWSATLVPESVSAAADCLTDCVKNCKKIAPKDPEYCQSNCKDYCAQEDRADGLSGSVSASNGEVGILGGTFGQGTVPKGEDKPPSIQLPGLDFNSEKGKKLLGY